MRKVLIGTIVAGLSITGVGSALAKGPDPTGPAKFGLCNAYSHNSQNGKDHGQAFANLAASAAANNQTVEQFCSGATPGGK